MEIFQKSKLVRISQDDYTVSLKSIAIQNNDNEEELSESEYTNTKSLIGQLNWIGHPDQTDLCFDVCDSSFFLKERKIESIRQANKSIKKAEISADHTRSGRFKTAKNGCLQ